MVMYAKQLAQAKKDKASIETSQRSRRQRSKPEAPEWVPVRQSKTVDWERLPLDDGRIYLQIVGGEALEICRQMLAKRQQLSAEGKKLWRQVQRQLKPKKGMLPHGAKVKLDKLDYSGARVRISFDQPDSDARIAVQDAYREFIKANVLETWRLNSCSFSYAGHGEVNCVMAFNRRNKKGRQMQDQVRALMRYPSSNDVADKLLKPKPGQRKKSLDFCRFVGLCRMSVPVAFNHSDIWFLTLPVDTKKAPPKELELPRGTFKRLTMSQYWRMVEKQALEKGKENK